MSIEVLKSRVSATHLVLVLVYGDAEHTAYHSTKAEEIKITCAAKSMHLIVLGKLMVVDK